MSTFELGIPSIVEGVNMEIAIFLWIVSFFLSAVIGAKKGNPVGGAFLSLPLGPLGVTIVLLSEDKNRIACPYRAEKIQ
jgi:hypothetical protein